MSRTWEIDRHSDSSQEADSDTSLNSFIVKLSTMAAFPSSTHKPDCSDKGEKKDRGDEDAASSAQKLPVRGRSTSTSNVPQREDSKSPETDPDFQVSSYSSSSHFTTTSWIIGTGMISEAMVGSMISGDGHGEKSMQSSGEGDIFEDAMEKVETVKENSDEFIIADDLYGSESKTSEGEEESDYSIGEFDVHTNRISEKQAKVAAALTVVVLAMMLAWESRGSLTYGDQ
jgi:hypothetical protein